MEEGGFEPPKSATTDLQSAPFGHSGTPPYLLGAGGRTRTPDLLITNQLLYQLSYTSVCIEYELIHSNGYSIRKITNCQQKNSKVSKNQRNSVGKGPRKGGLFLRLGRCLRQPFDFQIVVFGIRIQFYSVNAPLQVKAEVLAHDLDLAAVL